MKANIFRQRGGNKSRLGKFSCGHQTQKKPVNPASGFTGLFQAKKQ